MMPRAFGLLPDGRPVMQATISGHGLTASVITLGASLQDLRLAGVGHPLVLGFPRLAPYLDEGRYFGAGIGRHANRIAHGRAVLDGQRLQLDRNQDGRHMLMAAMTAAARATGCWPTGTKARWRWPTTCPRATWAFPAPC